MKTRQWSNLVIISKLHFLGIYKKTQHIHFLVHGHISWSKFGLHLEGPKGFVRWFFIYWKEIEPWKLDHEKGYLLWSDSMVHAKTNPK